MLSDQLIFYDIGNQVSDGDGRASRLLLWNQPGNDITGMVARCEKVVNTCQEVHNFTLVLFDYVVHES